MAKEVPQAKAMVGGGSQVSLTKEERRPKKKHVKRLLISKAKNGGHVVEHEFESGPDMPYEPNASHVFGADDGVKHVQHIIRHAGIKGVTAVGMGAEQEEESAVEAKAAGAKPNPKAKAGEKPAGDGEGDED